MTRPLDPCGSVGAHNRHIRMKQPVDDACAQAWRDYKNGSKPAIVHVKLPDWDGAACATPRGMKLFADITPDVVPDVRQICRACPIQRTCLQWGVLYEDEGAWGGLTRDELRRERFRHGIRRQEPNSTWILPRVETAPRQKAVAA